MLDVSVLCACTCPLSTKEETRKLRALAPAWSRSSGLTSREPHEVCLALISPPLVSLPGKAAPKEALRHLPHEAWTLARVLSVWMMKTGRTRPLVEPRSRPQAGKSGDPRSEKGDSSPWDQGALGLGFKAKPKGKHGAPQAPIPCGPADAWRLIGRGWPRFPTQP